MGVEFLECNFSTSQSARQIDTYRRWRSAERLILPIPKSGDARQTEMCNPRDMFEKMGNGLDAKIVAKGEMYTLESRFVVVDRIHECVNRLIRNIRDLP